MTALRSFFIRLVGFLRRDARERELHDEFESHFQMHVDDNLRAGMSLAEARRDAHLHFGSVDSAKEEVRARWTHTVLEGTRQDIVYALRGLRRSRGFAATAILSLGLGTGAGIAIFTVADSILLRPLPFQDPNRLVMVWESIRPDVSFNVVSPANLRDWQSQNSVFEGIAALTTRRAVLRDGDRAEEFGIQFVTSNMFPMLGVHPFRGRLFTQAEDRPKAPNVVLLSYRLWQVWFGSDDHVIGHQFEIGGSPVTVIGIMPPGFYFRNREIDLWGPLGLDPARDYRQTAGRYLDTVARLKPGVSLPAAQTQMTAIASRLEQDYPAFDKNWTVNVEALRDSMVRDVKTSMLVLLGAVTLLLAVACANVANLLLARYTSRQREMAVRAAIGAGKWRVVRQLVTESLVLGLSGGLLGLGLARAAVAGLLALAPRDLSRNASIEVDLRIVAFALGLGLLTGLIFGLAPAFAASRADLIIGLREANRSSVAGHRGLRSGLVAAEVALSIVLLAGAGLLFRSLIGLQAVNPGIDTSRVLTFRVSIPPGNYRDPIQRIQFFNRAIERLRALPGVRSASAINSLPFRGGASGTDVEILGRPAAKPGEGLFTTVRTVTPGYFAAMGIPLKRGRDFSAADNSLETPYRFIVNETFARKYFAAEDPLTKSISVFMQDKNPFGEIVGIVGDVKEDSVDKDPSPTVYYNHAHFTTTSMVFVVRAQSDPLALAGPARRAIREVDAMQPIAQIELMENVVRETFARQRFSAVLLIGFSSVALVLAAIGIYGVLAYSVIERTREIGVRMALGADAARVIGMILSSGARVVASGIAIGLMGAAALTGFLKSLLFGVEAHDAPTFIGVPMVLALVAMLAAYLPARRASQVAPAEALRAD